MVNYGRNDVASIRNYKEKLINTNISITLERIGQGKWTR
jgi:hypothetical protein